MPYIREECICGAVIEVSKYYTGRYKGKKVHRNSRSGTTSETQKKINQRNSEKQLTRLLNTNFTDGDYYLTLTYKNEPHSLSEARKDIENFIRRVKYQYRKYGIACKYIHSTEYKAKRIHHHIVINKAPDTNIKYGDIWGKGYVKPIQLYTGGEYSKLSLYLIKETSLTYNASDGVYAKRYCQSKNLKKPKINKKIIPANSFSEIIKAYKGYEPIENKTVSGYTANGYRYISYVMRKIE